MVFDHGTQPRLQFSARRSISVLKSPGRWSLRIPNLSCSVQCMLHKPVQNGCAANRRNDWLFAQGLVSKPMVISASRIVLASFRRSSAWSAHYTHLKLAYQTVVTARQPLLWTHLVTLRGRHPAKTLGIRFECQHDGCLHFLVGFIQIHKTENSRSSRYAQEKRCYWWNMSTQSKAGIANQGPCRFIGV